MDTIRDILINVVLLFGLIFVVSLSNSNIIQKKLSSKIILGIIIGFVTVIIMLNAWELNTGAIFDTRSVMISVTAMFFSYITGIIATVIAIAYRIYVGGDGVYAGVLTLFTSFLIGSIWKRYVYNKWKINKYLSFYLLGLIVHIVMLLCQLTFPYPTNIEVLQRVGPVVIVVFPIAVMLVSIAIVNHQERIDYQAAIRKSERKYRTLIDNSKLGIIQYNLDGVIEIVNQAFADIMKTTQKQLLNLDMTKLPNKALVRALKKSLAGETALFEDYYTSYISGMSFDARVKFSPIYDNGVVIGGIGILEDLTREKQMHKNLEELKNRDILTNLLNRNAFDEFFFSTNQDIYYPISIATCDINTFQVINTSFGYDVGNDVLKNISNILIEYTKDKPDLKPYRIGGDEFALIMLNTSYKEAKEMISELQSQINHIMKFDFDINISCGISTSITNKTSLFDTFNEALADMMSNKIYDGSSISIKTIDVIMNTLFEKSKRERMHSERVSVIAKKIAEKFSLGTAFTNRVALAGKLHDIGKITVAEEILDKPGKLNSQEWQRIQKHPETGFKILSTVPEYLDIANVVYAHHERFDGKGYPRGLKANQTPLESRIIGVADAFDAMTVTRPYRTALTIDEAIKEIKDFSGTQFDPLVVEKFLMLYDENQLQV
jgi:diguanylate cyclase (GGDEF)-like protein/PAS domain S-box-containing protein